MKTAEHLFWSSLAVTLVSAAFLGVTAWMLIPFAVGGAGMALAVRRMLR